MTSQADRAAGSPAPADLTAAGETAAGETAAASKSEQAYAWVKERIQGGQFTPGHRLVLAQLAGDLGCSAVPVREAIRRLEAEGLVTFERNVGATVAGIDPLEYLYSMQALGIVEGAATALAAPLLTTADLARARAVNTNLRELLADFDPVSFTALNKEFHGILFERCPNPHLLALVRRGWNQLQGLRSSTFSHIPNRARESVAEHQALLALIESGAGADAIEHAARAHRTATLDAYLTHSSQGNRQKGTQP